MKSQIALWMLTKMAMLFFIVGLALLITTFGNRQRAITCSDQADFTARALAGVINNVINSPVEDERKILALEASLSLGKTDFERYEVNVTKIVTESAGVVETGFFSILVKPAAVGCSGGASVPFEKFSVRLIGPGKAGDTLLFEPSKREGSRFLVVLKCKQKTYPPENFLFIEDCRQEEGGKCIGFTSEAVVGRPGAPYPCGFP